MVDAVTPVLLYAPGLGRYSENTADTVADVLARTKDMLTPGETFGTKTDPEVAAPRGLRVAKTIVNESDSPVLQLFELDYMAALDPPSSAAGPPVGPGLLRSAAFALLGGRRWWTARKRAAKSRRAKAQLFVGLVAVGALLFAFLTSFYFCLVAVGLDVPGAGIFGDTAARWAFGSTSLGLVVTWAAIRKQMLALAATTERLIRFVRNEGAAADTTSVILDEAIDGLVQRGWKGPIHILGYSFGSLVLYEAMFPRESSLRSAEPVASVASLVTIGCPLDMVRLYEPSFVGGRRARRAGLRWTNIFNQADIFASNLKDGDDTSEGVSTARIAGADDANSIRYLNQTLSWFGLFTSGKLHAGYWATAGQANCFEPLVSIWMPPAAPEPGLPPGAPA